MATERLRYVNTDSTSGGDGTTNNTTGGTRAFVSRSDAEAAEQAAGADISLATGSDEFIRFVIDGSADDTAAVAVAGFTTQSPDNFIVFENESANLHSGHPGARGNAPLRVSNGYASAFIATGGDHLKMIGQWVENTHPTHGNSFGFRGNNDASWPLVQNCVGIGGNGSGTCAGFGEGSGIYENCLALDGNQGFHCNGTMLCVNCGAADVGGLGFNEIGGALTVKNCWGYLCSSNAFDTGLSGDYNYADDASAAAFANPATNEDLASGDFTNAASQIYTLVGTGSTLYNAGLGNASDSDVPTTDFEGDARGDPTSIGFDEVAAAGGGSPLTFQPNSTTGGMSSLNGGING